MSPAERYRWSLARCDWWDWWVPCPACGYPMALDPDEYCDFCAYFPSDWSDHPDKDSELMAARANVARSGMAEPEVDEQNADFWQPMVDHHMEAGLLERKARFARDFERLVRDEQRGFFTREEIIRRLTRMRMAFFQAETEADVPEPWEREFRRNQGYPY